MAFSIFTPGSTHGRWLEQALRGGRYVYSSVPPAISEEETERINDAVREARMVRMMGEASYYKPATVYACHQHALGKFGRIFYTEGAYLHDTDLGTLAMRPAAGN